MEELIGTGKGLRRLKAQVASQNDSKIERPDLLVGLPEKGLADAMRKHLAAKKIEEKKA